MTSPLFWSSSNFEARIYTLGLSDSLLDRIETTPQKNVETNEERGKRQIDREGEEADLAKLQGHYEMKQDLVNFASSRGLCVSSETSMTAFHSAGRKSPKRLKCEKTGHRAKDSHSRETRTCFKRGQKGHLASSCRNGGQRSSIGGCGSGQSSNRDIFNFGAFRACCYDMGSIELLFDSGCNGFKIKNKELFSDLQSYATLTTVVQRSEEAGHCDAL